MTPFNHFLVLVSFILAGALVIFQIFQPEPGEPTSECCLLQLVKENQRHETLENLRERTLESLRHLQTITRKLINKDLPLQEALASYCEVYNQLYFVRGWIAEGKEKPLTEKRAFKMVLERIRHEMKKSPAEAREITLRLQKEWQALHGKACSDAALTFAADRSAHAR